ncbi:MAG: GNAT family N-acetyltransferase [Cyclobacteriaceae bacterium]|nr:GNAT family N-acetyltransferase [Cyclobacteriaceae bacterium]
MAGSSRQRMIVNFSDDALYVYNSSRHLQLQAKKGWVIFELTGPRHLVIARICVNIKQSTALSPVRAPFGSFEIYSRLSSSSLLKFIQFVETGLVQKGIKQMIIKNWPAVYQPVQARQLYKVLVTKLQFKVSEEVSSVIPVSNKPLRVRMKISERQKARKAEKMFLFSLCRPSEYKTIYDFILTCRQERGQSLSLSWKEMENTISKLPDRFMFFKLTGAEAIAAAAIVIRVSDKIWYTFYYAHAATYNKVSPVVHLLECIYNKAANEKVKLIDLGTSMLHDKINMPLLHFKKSVGAVTVPKFTFSKVYG